MSAPYTVPYNDSRDPLQLQWQDGNGNGTGSWNGSADGHSTSLDNWDLHTSGSPTYYFEFSTNQSTYNVYAMVTETGDGTVYYGAKFGTYTNAQGQPCDGVESTATLSFSLTGNQLSFIPCELISDDPKIQISTAKGTPSTCTLDWDGTRWTMNGGSVDGALQMAFSSANTITVTVNDTSGDSNWSALYYPLGSPNVGSGTIPVHVTGSSGTYTLTLTQAMIPTSVTELTVNLFESLSPGDHHTLKSRS